MPYWILGILAAHATIVQQWPAYYLEIRGRTEDLWALSNAIDLRLRRILAIRRHFLSLMCVLVLVNRVCGDASLRDELVTEKLLSRADS